MAAGQTLRPKLEKPVGLLPPGIIDNGAVEAAGAIRILASERGCRLAGGMDVTHKLMLLRPTTSSFSDKSCYKHGFPGLGAASASQEEPGAVDRRYKSSAKPYDTT